MALTQAAQAIEEAVAVTTVETLSGVSQALDGKSFAMMTLDLGLKDSQGLSNLSVVLADHPELPVLVVSGHDSDNIVRRAAALGARGFLSKSASIAEMKSAIGIVLEGGTVFPSGLDKDVDLAETHDRLSPAQNKVMIELAKGHSNKIIAHELGLSEATIKSHLSAVYRILGVTNRSQAILALQESGESAI